MTMVLRALVNSPMALLLGGLALSILARGASQDQQVRSTRTGDGGLKWVNRMLM